MSFAHAGRWGPEAILDPNGALMKNNPVWIYQVGITTPATVYSDKNRTSTLTQPLTTSALGDLTFFADPGDYDLALIISNITQSPLTITVEVDPLDVSSGPSEVDSDANGNVWEGPEALFERNASTVGCTAIGAGALHHDSVGGRNTAVGLGAGYALNGDQNTIVGYGALGVNVGGSNIVAIGNAAMGNATATACTAVGSAALYENEAARCTAIGFDALSNSVTGADNTAVGDSAMVLNTTGFANTALGSAALWSNTSGVENVAVGVRALNANTNGYENVAVGYQSMLFNTTGLANTAVGIASMQSNQTGIANVAVGELALSGNTDGNNNTALGPNAMAGNGHGSDNVAIGDQALATNYLGSNNVAIGVGAAYSTTDSDTTAVGGSTIVAGRYAMALGRFASASAAGAVAIGADHFGGAATSATQDLIVLGTSNHRTQIPGIGAFVSGDKYMVVDSSGNIHKSALGPAS